MNIWFLVVGGLGILGCPADNSPLHSENHRLKKQMAKQESVIASLQEGNKVMQQQIDLLNQEGRENRKNLEQELRVAQEKMRQLSQGHREESQKLETLEAENLKLSADARWLRTQRDRMRKALKIQQAGGKKQELTFPYESILKMTESALTRNGYKVMASMQTDQKAVYVTDRKISKPISLEFTGFSNQYFLAVEKGEQQTTSIWVKADFEKLPQNGQIREAEEQEVSEIEFRLIQEIQRALENTPSSDKPSETK